MKGSVLYVEDDADLREALADGLAELGYEARVVADGPTALEELERRRADVVLIDLRLPGMDGVELCRRIKELAPGEHVPVIFVTGLTDVREKVRALEAGDDFCVKPVLLDELDARIRAHLRVRERQQRLADETQKFRRFALVDPLTELGNRRGFEAKLEREWARFTRAGRPLGLLGIDVDFFKEFNDRHGHRTGDFVLRAVANAVSGAIRTSDEAFRVGGDEFTIIAPEADASGVLAIARRVEEAVLRASHGPLAITVSIGGAAVPASGIESADALVGAADSALYDAKGAGRGRIAVAFGPASSEAPDKATAKAVNEPS